MWHCLDVTGCHWLSDPISFDMCRSDLKRFSNDHWRRGRWKLGSRTVGSSISEELITLADCQSSRHRLDTEAVVSAAGFTLQTRCLDGSISVGWSVTSVKSGRWSLNSTLLSNLDSPIASSRRRCGGGIWLSAGSQVIVKLQRTRDYAHCFIQLNINQFSMQRSWPHWCTVLFCRVTERQSRCSIALQLRRPNDNPASRQRRLFRVATFGCCLL